jgi:hypothetical protein
VNGNRGIVETATNIPLRFAKNPSALVPYDLGYDWGPKNKIAATTAFGLADILLSSPQCSDFKS